MKNVMELFGKKLGMLLFAFFMLLFIGCGVNANKVMAAENESGYKQPTFEKVDNLKDYYKVSSIYVQKVLYYYVQLL